MSVHGRERERGGGDLYAGEINIKEHVLVFRQTKIAKAMAQT